MCVYLTPSEDSQLVFKLVKRILHRMDAVGEQGI